MTKPLALIFYERLMPGSQLVNRLQDLGYRVSTCTELAGLLSQVEQELPMVLVMDLNSERGDVNGVIKGIHASEKASHIPILAFTNKTNKLAQDAAVEAGAKLVAGDEAILQQLPHLLDQALEID